MKELDLRKVTDEVERMCIEGNYFIGKEVLDKIKEAYAKEESEVGKNILGQIIENDEIAMNEQVPMCQDTGIVVVFLEIGTEVKINGDIYEAVNEGVRRGSRYRMIKTKFEGMECQSSDRVGRIFSSISSVADNRMP